MTAAEKKASTGWVTAELLLTLHTPLVVDGNYRHQEVTSLLVTIERSEYEAKLQAHDLIKESDMGIGNDGYKCSVRLNRDFYPVSSVRRNGHVLPPMCSDHFYNRRLRLFADEGL